jgi:hypothetical protein
VTRLFAALRESVVGTSRHFAATHYPGRFRGEADMTNYKYAPEAPGAEKASPGTMSNNAGAPQTCQGYATLRPPLAKSGARRLAEIESRCLVLGCQRIAFRGHPRGAPPTPWPKTPSMPQNWALVRFGPCPCERLVSGASKRPVSETLNGAGRWRSQSPDRTHREIACARRVCARRCRSRAPCGRGTW